MQTTKFQSKNNRGHFQNILSFFLDSKLICKFYLRLGQTACPWGSWKIDKWNTFWQNNCMKNIYKCLKTKHFSIKIGGENFPGKIVNIQVLLLRSLSTHPNNQGKSEARFNRKENICQVRHCVKCDLNIQKPYIC